MIRLFFFFSLFVSVACDHALGLKVENKKSSDPVTAVQGFELANFETLCRDAGGSFNLDSQECHCPSIRDQQTRSFSAIFSRSRLSEFVEGFRCLENPLFQVTGSSKYDSFEEILEEEGRQALIKELQQVRYTGNRRVLKLHIYPYISPSELRILAKKLDQNPLTLRIPNGYTRGDDYNVYYMYPNVNQAHVKLALNFPFHNFDGIGINQVGRFVYAWSFEDLKSLISGEEEFRSSDSVQTSLQKNGALLLLEQARIALQKFERNEPHRLSWVEMEMLPVSKGCQILCKSVMHFRHEQQQFWLEKHYVYGNVLHRFLYMGERDSSRKDGVLVLGEGLQPSFAIINERSYQVNPFNMKIISKVFDHNYRELEKFEWEAFAKPAEIEKAFEEMSSAPVSHRSVPTLLFGKFDVTEKAVHCRLRMGEYRQISPDLGGSFFGWIRTSGEAPRDDLELFLDGVYDPWSNSDSLHSKLVLEALQPGRCPDEPHIIPLGYQSLISGQYREVMRDSGSRLLVLPATFPVSAEACQRLIPKSPDDALWVFAAGNDGVESPTFRCPQSLDQTRVVVAALRGSALDFESDFGSQYADLAADGLASNGYRGTSFAAPKVAKVASEIMNTFPRLKAFEVRLALLIGSRFNPDRPLPVRSGGVLDRSNALKVADYIDGLTFAKRRVLGSHNHVHKVRLYRAMIQSFSKLNQEQIERQVKYLTKNGV